MSEGVAMTARAVATLASVLPDHGDDRELDRHDDVRILRVARAFRGVLDALGLDLADPNLADTPIRVARAYHELLAGLDERTEPELRTFPNDQGYSQMVAVTGIPFQSICAHHFLPFFGTASVAYVPGDRVVGLSKLARIVDFYARRPQLQERMTEQIVELLDTRLRPRGAMVVLEGRHLCMEMRGVRKPGARTRTSAIRGAFADAPLREEFLRTLHTGVST